ncbi:MAG: hypothetical protein AAGI37_05945 [Planctomycetota bacterium]
MNTAPPYANAAQTAAPAAQPRDSGYGRARLRLGITGVGLWVAASAVLLVTGAADTVADQLPAGLAGDGLLVALLLATYVLIQLPLDWLGGYAMPKRFARRTPPLARYAATLARGIAAHTTALFLSAAALYAGGSLGGLPGAFAAGLAWMLCLAALRGTIAGAVAGLVSQNDQEIETDTRLKTSSDEGFTGGITGLFAPKTSIMPSAWRDNLSDDQFELVLARRQTVMRDGLWLRGRLGAIGFTAAGLLTALLLAGPNSAGTGVGVVETSLWFTLWSFVGLLFLPSLSRAAIYTTDEKLKQQGVPPERFEALTHALDQLQDGEPVRGRWVERVFHPIPSASNRIAEPAATGGYWDIARTSVYLGLSSMSLLTRSVHCNVGRPALWVWLPTD